MKNGIITGEMNEIFDIIDELRVKVESCKRDGNGTEVGDVLQELNKLDNKLIRSRGLGSVEKEETK